MPGNTARASAYGSAFCSGRIGFGSRFAIGASDLIRRPFRRIILGWRASGNGRGCWEGSAASAAEQARAPASWSSCPWCQGTKRNDRAGVTAASLFVNEMKLPVRPHAAGRLQSPLRRTEFIPLPCLFQANGINFVLRSAASPDFAVLLPHAAA